jgi:regulator of protease activity HflC (stomatin/prohibitin superfamily)
MRVTDGDQEEAVMIIPWLYFLQEDQQLLVESFTRRWTVNGPGTFLSRPFYRVTRKTGITLGPTDYVHVRDTLTGELRIERGPQLFFPTATEEVIDTLSAIPLKHNQYIRLLDKSTGTIRVEQGEKSVYVSPTETMLENVQDGINLDEDTAVLIRDTESGQLRQIADAKVYFPTATEEIVQERRRIRLEDHETVVVKDPTGQYRFHRGTDEERAFFLEPHHQLVVFRWSTGIHKDQRDLKITHLDSRPKFMWYEFEVRTKDNVELIIGVTFFWQIVDVAAMVRTTDDAPGDICSHARSTIIQVVSQVTLEHFLDEFNAIIRQAIIESDDPFYDERGVELHAVEVRSITCKDADTQRILQEIIQETTNRLNRLQQQESRNEIRLKEIQGEIEAEDMRGQLLDVQREHTRAEAAMEGEAEAERTRAFLAGLGDGVSLEDGLALFHLLRKQEIMQALSQGTAQLYFTPSDVNLTIET